MYFRNLNDTLVAGEIIGRYVEAGDTLLLHGDLGSGKTSLVQGIARGLGIQEMVNSPTFNLVNEYYQGHLPLYHMDAYRLENLEEAYDIGIEDLLNHQGLLVIEWPEMLEPILPKEAKHLYMRHDGEGRRLILPTEMEVWYL